MGTDVAANVKGGGGCLWVKGVTLCRDSRLGVLGGMFEEGLDRTTQGE